MADEEFRITGLSPTYAFLLSILNEGDGITQKEIGEVLDVTPSTITRFIDKLENSGHLERRIEGKNSFIYSTEKGKGNSIGYRIELGLISMLDIKNS